MNRFPLLLLAALLMLGCAQTPPTSPAETKTSHTPLSDSAQPAADGLPTSLLSQDYRFTTEQDEQRLESDKESGKQVNVVIYPLTSAMDGRALTLYEPNAIMSNIPAMPKPLRLRYQAAIDQQLVATGKVQLVDEAQAQLHLYTLYSVRDNRDGTITIEYHLAAADWPAAQQAQSSDPMLPLINHTVWGMLIRAHVAADTLLTDGKIDNEKQLATMIQLSRLAMRHFLASRPEGS